MKLSIAEKNKIRATLREHNINGRTMSDDEMVAKYNELTGEGDARPAQLPVRPARKKAETPQHDDETLAPVDEQPNAAAVAQIAELLAKLAPQQKQPVAPAFDEEQLIALIKEYGTKTLNIQPAKDREAVSIEGAHDALEDLVLMLSADTMPYLVGPAGSGKTTLAIQAAQALDLPFYSHGAVMAPYELIGHHDANGNYKSTALREAFEHGGVLLLDEIDACSARALVTINQLLANGQYTFPDGEVKKHPDFKAIGAANTHGHGATRQYSGRNPLDGASLDRFVELEINYDNALEYRVAHAEYKAHGGTDDDAIAQWCIRVSMARKAAETLKINALITPRASLYGGRLLAKGFTVEKLDKMVLFKGLSSDAVAQIKGAL